MLLVSLLVATALAAPPFDPSADYAQYCALCHGADREGHAADHAPSLRSPELLGGASRDFLAAAIAYGRPGTPMAAFAADQGGPLDEGRRGALLDWLITEARVTPAPVPDASVLGDAKRGRQVYARSCSSCHGSRGEGVAGPALANPVLLATASDAYLRDAIARGRSGTPMVAFEGTLSPAEIDDVTAYLRQWATPWSPPSGVVVRPPDPTNAVVNPGSPPAKLTVRAGRFVPADEVNDALKAERRLVLLDARPMSDWQRGHLPGALPVPFYDGVDAIAAHLPRDGTPIIAYCACPHAASGRVVDALRALGFSAAVVLDEGSLVWAERGYPLVQGASAP